MKLTKKIIDNKEVYFENGIKKYVYYKNSSGYEYWTEYDSNNNQIHSKNNEGYEYWKEYDSNSNEIHFKVSNGNEYWSDDNPDNPKNKAGEEVDIKPFTFNK